MEEFTVICKLCGDSYKISRENQEPHLCFLDEDDMPIKKEDALKKGLPLRIKSFTP